MKIDRLHLKNYKNLKDFEIDFDEKKVKQVIVGRNGTGKSNLFEAITIIFRDLDLQRDTNFGYEIEYMCKDTLIKVENVIEKETSKVGHYIKHIYIKTERDEKTNIFLGRYVPLKLNEFNSRNKDKSTRLLPSYVFAYYSGLLTRLKETFRIHERNYYKEQVAGNEESLRPLFLAKSHHSQFALLAFYASDDPKAKEFLKTEFGITGIESVLFSLREPFWRMKKPPKQKKEKGDPRFWYASGKVAPFLNQLFECSFVPMACMDRIETNLDKYQTKERRYCYLPDEKSLVKLADKSNLETKEFFARLESMFYSDLIDTEAFDIKININHENSKTPITFLDLSEGERQLITVLGLMRFTAEDEALFLLDEPDTHQNPAWCLDYLKNIEKYGAEPPNSQIIMTTHNPLTFAGLEKEEVIILEQSEEGKVFAFHPTTDPRGMGVEAILTSELFGLRATLDEDTLKKLDRRRELGFKDKRTEKEEGEFNDLILELGNLDFSKTARDPLYLEYLRAITSAQKKHPGIAKLNLDAISWKERKRISQKITKEILKVG